MNIHSDIKTWCLVHFHSRFNETKTGFFKVVHVLLNHDQSVATLTHFEAFKRTWTILVVHNVKHLGCLKCGAYCTNRGLNEIFYFSVLALIFLILCTNSENKYKKNVLSVLICAEALEIR